MIDKERQEARPADPRLLPGNCHKCGLPRSDNPHPEAGRPSHYLEVGCPKECIPCLVLSRHQWAQRAMKAENKLKDIATNREAVERIRKALNNGFQPSVSDCRTLLEALDAEASEEAQPAVAEPANLDEAVRVFEQAACHETYRLRAGVAAVLRYAATPLPEVVDEQFTRAWINLDALPGGMMHGSQIGRFGPIAASSSCWITTSEKEAERLREKGPVLEIFTHPATISQGEKS